LLSQTNVHYSKAHRNLGYFGAAKWQLAKLDFADKEFVIVSNSDVYILNEDFFYVLSQSLDMYDVIAPSIQTPEGIEQNPHRKSPYSLRRKMLFTLYFSNYVIASIIANVIALKKSILRTTIIAEMSEQRICSPHGAFVIFTKNYFANNGYIDDGYFLYGEEDSISAIVEQNNLKIGFVPRLRVLHFESVTTGKGLSKTKYGFQKEARGYIKIKYPHLF
jgi:GT2 family glycosyltransferase